MRILLMLLLAVGGILGASAQNAVQLAQVEAGDFTALAVTDGGARLMVADAANQQIRVYDLSDRTNPTLFTAIDVDGTPRALATADGYAFAAIENAGEHSVQVVAATPFNPRNPYMIGLGYFALDSAPRALKLSPNQNWGVVVGANDVTVLAIYAQDDILTLPANLNVDDVALTNDRAFLLMGDRVEFATLNDNSAMRASDGFDLPAEGALIEISGAAGAVASGSRLFVFSVDEPEQQTEIDFGGAPISGIYALSRNRFGITFEDSSAVTLIDVRDPLNPVDLGSTDALFDRPIRALTSFGDLFFATDGTTISIFST